MSRALKASATAVVGAIAAAGWLAAMFLALVAGPCVASAGEAVFDAPGFEQRVAPLLQRHCARCHEGSKPKGDFQWRQLPRDFADPAAQLRWRGVRDVLIEHEMPPRKEPQPPAALVTDVIDWISGQVARAEEQTRGGTTVLRRLNRDEYRNTMRDLLGVEVDVGTIPLDPAAGGFSNNGRALVMSPLLLEAYADLAREALDRALVEGVRPKKVRWRFEPEAGDSDDHRVNLGGGQRPIVQSGKAPKEKRNGAGFAVLKRAGWDRDASARDFHVPVPGEYVVRVRAAGRTPARAEVVAAAEPRLRRFRDERNQEQPANARYHEEEYQRDLAHFRSDRNYDYGPARLRLSKTEGADTTVLGQFDVDAPVTAPRVYEFRARFSGETLDLKAEHAYEVPPFWANQPLQGSDDLVRPEVWLDWLEIEGPLFDQWPPSSQTALLKPADGQTRARDKAGAVLAAFMPRALRRPVSAAEIEAKLRLFDTGLAGGRSFVAAIKLPLIAVLTSPGFLYLVEDTGEGGQLTDHQLASRLSYFLWSTMPDDRLMAVAARGGLRAPGALVAEADRMLADGRSAALIDNFAAEWLGLREVGSNPPVPELYPDYDSHLQTSMVRESKGFFAEVLQRDRSVLSFLRSDFVVINERLARFYGVDGVRGDDLRVVKLAPGSKRGGLLTQGAMLSATSNGTRTSPVKRGVWVMKTLLGTDPGLPVGNAGDLPPKVPGIDKASVRQRLQAHRENPQCARCHTKIDPLGLALENYDAAGAFRSREATRPRGLREERDPPIDASARLPDGSAITGIEGLQAQLTKQAPQFRRALAGKVLTYALGRQLGVSDQNTVAAAATHMEGNGDTMRSLIRFVVGAPAFRAK